MVGGGNIFRGASWAGCSGLDRSSADYIGYRTLLVYFHCLPLHEILVLFSLFYWVFGHALMMFDLMSFVYHKILDFF